MKQPAEDMAHGPPASGCVARICRLGVLVALMACLAPPSGRAAEPFDVVVYGATPGGIASAITAARFGRTVGLVEYHNHVGGMAASGLGKSDILTRSAVAGLFTEFTSRVHRDYLSRYAEDSEAVRLCREGYYYEPSVAERVFRRMLAEQPAIRLFPAHRLDETIRQGRRLVGLRAVDRRTGDSVELRGRVFIDASYEGDLAASAGARYRLGRESRSTYNEMHAGVIYMDHRTWTVLPGSTGEGDGRLPAYTFRLCLSTDPANQVPISRPADYDRSRYVNYFDDVKLGRIPGFLTALSIAALPNQKTDVNMKPWPLGFPFAEENGGYVEADWQTRETVVERLRSITLGLLYFLQNDPEIPEEAREQARQYGLAKDEFTDSDNFPWQLYVREARRIVGHYTITEHDLVLAPGSSRAPVHADAVASAAFPIDSFPTRRREPGRSDALEGYLFMMRNITRPYQIPYRAIVPADVEGLLVPVALSASHVAFSAIRMEPTWMAIGQAAGTAAHLSLEEDRPLSDLPVEKLQRLLLEHGQVIAHFDDRHELGEFEAPVEFFGTKGFFAGYRSRPFEPITRGRAAAWLSKAVAVSGLELSQPRAGRLSWKDYETGDEGFSEAAALSLAGLVDALDPSAPFRPDAELTVGEFAAWLARAAALLIRETRAAGAASPADSPEPVGFAVETWLGEGQGGDQQLGRSVHRAEICRALYRLLEQAGY